MPHKLSSTHLINQGDTSIYNPGTSTPAFTDANFFKNCGKTGATGTIQKFGCPICDLAMFILYKGGLSNATKSNVYYAVWEATKRERTTLLISQQRDSLQKSEVRVSL